MLQAPETGDFLVEGRSEHQGLCKTLLDIVTSVVGDVGKNNLNQRWGERLDYEECIVHMIWRQKIQIYSLDVGYEGQVGIG